MTDSTDDPDESHRLPPSALYTRYVVQHCGPITRQELLEETNLAERTLDEALDRLTNDGLVRKRRRDDDLRVIVAETATE